ncbi:hypothetical protein CBR_g37150 [Chara braunii]|uniref:Uncharacterized protein n=1 Tax=Chara braunii TaxID=69332 RepID=A0A388LMA6_CHABU|nr:hypothetical protein CBR_g37150 [Chara braunii]|eukprot:GBG83437.1 hypothetical protein CBR_g37150 [Chara braunii]
MAACIRDGGAAGPNRNDSNGILLAPQQGSSASTSNAIVPYQGPQSRSYNGNSEGYSGYGGSYNSGGSHNNRQRYARQWNGGYMDRERGRDEKIDRLYGLLSDQVEEREQRKREAAKLELLEEEKKKLQAEEEKKVQAIKEREQQEARLGRIVRTSVKAVCESALGRKVDIPEDEDGEVTKLRKELEDLRAKSSVETSASRLEALRKEKEALLRMRNQEGEEERLLKEIAELRSRKELGPVTEGKQDEIMALQLQVKKLSAFRTALEQKNAEVSALKSENSHLKKEFSDLREDFILLRSKRSAGAVTESSPPEEPAKGKPRAESSTMAMYTPKDMEDLWKAYKDALAGKEIAVKEAEMCKERMARMGASRIRLSSRRASVRKTTPRNLRTSFQGVEVMSDDEGKDSDKDKEKGKTRDIVDVTHDLEVAKMAGFREIRLKELRQAKKVDMEAACEDEGITYIKLDQARDDVAEIRASRDYAAWLKEKESRDEEDRDQQYTTSNEDVGDE